GSIRQRRVCPSAARHGAPWTIDGRGRRSRSRSTRATATSLCARSWLPEWLAEEELHSPDRVGADLPDGDPEDPHRVSLLGRLLGDQGGAEARGGRRGPCVCAGDANAAMVASAQRPGTTAATARGPRPP